MQTTQTETVKRERVVRSSTEAAPNQESNQHPIEEKTLVKKETTTKLQHEHEPQGFLSATVHLVGEILALPFRLVAGLLHVVF